MQTIPKLQFPIPAPRRLPIQALVTFVLLLSDMPLIAGAWTPEKGRTYLKFSANLFKSDANYDLNGNRVDPFEDFDDRYAKFRDENLSLYFEHGLHDRLALFGTFTHKEVEQSLKNASLNLSFSNRDWADFEVGVRYRFTEGPNIWAVAFTAKLPFLYDEDDDIPIGNGQEDYELRLLYGRGLGHGFYTGAEAAYRLRTSDPSDEWRFLGELGWSHRRFYTRTKLDAIRGVDDFEPGSTTINPLLNPIFDLTKLELTAGFAINKTWQIEYTYTDTLDGKNTAEGFNNQWAVVASF